MKQSIPFFFILLSIFLFSVNSSGQTIKPAELDKLVMAKMPMALKEHRELVSIPNDANYPEDMDKNIDWLKPTFEKRDFEVKILETSTVPIFFAEMQINKDLPTVLFYLHFDGQPVDPSKWEQEHPFKPVLKKRNKKGDYESIPYESIEKEINMDWRVFGRAAADDKGPIMMFLTAIDLMKEKNIVPAYNIKILLDGEEEKGSAGLKSTLEKYKKTYAADRLIIMDGPAHPTNQPTLTFGCRGIASATMVVYGPKLSQHSGHFGNYAPNPIFRAARLLSSMKDEEGRVLIDGFYDGIDLDENTRKILAAVPDDEKLIQSLIGVAAAEKVGANYQESLQYPSLNARGMRAAWIGRQTRTIVPDKAVVQLGIRLVPESEGDRLLALVKKHIEDQGYFVIDREPTEEERLKHPKIVTFFGKKSVNAFRTPLDSPTGNWLSKAIQNVYGQEPVRIRIMGGTVPVVPLIEGLNVPAVIVPMVNMDNNQHSPNENLRLGNFYNGVKTCFGVLTEGFLLE